MMNLYFYIFFKFNSIWWGFADKTHSQNKLSQGKKSPHTDSNNINQNFSVNPYFDFTVARNLTTRVGQTAFLHCRVEQLGDKSVSIILLSFSYTHVTVPYWTKLSAINSRVYPFFFFGFVCVCVHLSLISVDDHIEISKI